MLLFESAIRATLVAVVIALVLWVMRIKTASVRHAVWAGVVVLMLLLPAWVAWGPKAPIPVLPAERNRAIDLLPLPSSAGPAETVPRTSPVREYGGYASLDPIAAIYFLGFGVLLLRLAIGTLRANRLTSTSCVVPITVGFLRPRIILPECSREWSPAQRDVVLTHEGEHVRRRDPLFQWLALLNRAIFWFHPLAWWLDRKLSGLAEEACDAAVIAKGHDPRDYSGYLLDLARKVNRSGLRVGMAMPGEMLQQRIRRMLSGIPASKISRPRMACAGAVCAAAAAILAAGTIVHAQSQSTAKSVAPKYEVVSIRPCEDGGLSGGGRGEGPGSGAAGLSPGRLHVNCNTLESLIQGAYHTYANGLAFRGFVAHDSLNPIEGGPGWINSERYYINAIAQSNPSIPMMRGPMMQALLEDRFKLKIRREIRQVPVYALTVAKRGLQLQLREEGSCTLLPGERPPNACGNIIDGTGVLDAYGLSMSEFSRDLRNVVNRPVIDKTGITGMFDFHLKYQPDEATRRENSFPNDLGGVPGFLPSKDPTGYPSIFTAVQEQLGLKLDRTLGPDEFLVIDHVEKPSEN